MKLMIRAHDLGVKGDAAVARAVKEHDLDGVQLVAYKCTDDIKYEAGGITPDRAAELGKALKEDEKLVRLANAKKAYEEDKELQKYMIEYMKNYK